MSLRAFLMSSSIVLDTTPPVITLIGDSVVNIFQGDNYIEQGYSAIDDVDGDITANVVVTGVVDTATVGQYVLYYNVDDSSGNSATEVQRIVNVLEPEVVWKTFPIPLN